MIDIIQIYKSKAIFGKADYTPNNRRQFENISIEVYSSMGYVKNQSLFLPFEYKNQPNLNTSDLIIIQDITGFNPYLANKDVNHKGLRTGNNELIFGIKHVEIPKSFEIFKICKKQDDNYDLYINYVANSMVIGEPARENHKICELKMNQPIRYKINGKSDFTMSGRKERCFYEFDYIIELIEKVEHIEFLALNKIQKEKKIPLRNCKLIDERKILH